MASGAISLATTYNKYLGMMVAGYVGGVTAELSGGKFANGAQTASMQYLFNEAASDIDLKKKDHYLARAAGKELRRVNELSDSDFAGEFSQYGYSGGNDALVVDIAKDHITNNLKGIAREGI